MKFCHKNFPLSIISPCHWTRNRKSVTEEIWNFGSQQMQRTCCCMEMVTITCYRSTLESPCGLKSTSLFSHCSWKLLSGNRCIFENEFLYKGRNNVTISQTWEFLFLVYLCPFVCNFAVKFIFVVSVLVIMFLIKSMVSISSTLVSPPKEKCV